MREPDKRTKWTYCIGATGRDAAYALVSMYLISYIQYTMQLTAAQFAAISACMVAAMIWDAVNDPLMGIIIENSHLKGGKFRPWILIGVLANALVIILLFNIRPQGWGFVIFFAISYFLWGMTYTMNDIAYWGMLPSLSSDPGVRNTLITIMSIFICVGQFAVAGIVPTVIAGNAVRAYGIIAVVVAFAFIAFQLLTFFGVREQPRRDNPHLSLGGMFKVFARNDQLIAAGIACLLFNVGQNLLIVFGVNFFYIEFGYSEGGGHIFLFTVMYGLGTLCSQAIFSLLSKHFKRTALLTFCMILLFVSYGLFLSFGFVLPKIPLLIHATGFIIFFCQGLFNLVLLVMVNNTIEYDELRHGERHDSVISAARSFAVKLAGGINQGISALVLIISGIYAITQSVSALEVDVATGALTSEGALSLADQYLSQVSRTQSFTLRLGMVLIPVIAIFGAYLILRIKYRIDEKEYDRIVSEIESRKAS